MKDNIAIIVITIMEFIVEDIMNMFEVNKFMCLVIIACFN